MSTYTKDEIAENNGQNGKPAWMIIKGKVYDVTPLLGSVSIEIGTFETRRI